MVPIQAMLPQSRSRGLRLRTRRAALSFAALAVIGSAPGQAHAAEREWVLTPSLGWAVARVGGAVLHGGSAAWDADYGLTDSFSLRGTLHYEGLALPGPAGPGLFSRGGLGVGALYVFDVLQVVPYVSITVGAAGAGGGGEPLRWNAEARISVGLDWLIRRDFSAGLEVCYGLLAPDFQRFPWAITVAIRLSYRRP